MGADSVLSEIEVDLPDRAPAGWRLMWGGSPSPGVVDLVTRFTFQRPPIFCRHICPAHVRIPLVQAADDLDALVCASGSLVEPCGARSFSKQHRQCWHGRPTSRSSTWNAPCGGCGSTWCPGRRAPSGAGGVRRPGTGRGVSGVSRAIDNLSDWRWCTPLPA